MPTKSQLGVPAASETDYPCPTSSPDRGLRKRASSEADKYKTNPPPSYSTAMGEEQPPEGVAPPSPSPEHLSSSLEVGMASLNLTEEKEHMEDKEEGREMVAELERRQSIDRRAELHDEDTEEPSGTDAPNASSTGDACAEESSQHTGIMNGSLVPEQVPEPVPDLCCSVEQAEEIMGTEATGLGMGIGLGLGLAAEARMDDYRCIPVDQAVAVECDEQVLGELDAAGFEEFSRRIYALNENMSSFRRPRKNSDK